MRCLQPRHVSAVMMELHQARKGGGQHDLALVQPAPRAPARQHSYGSKPIHFGVGAPPIFRTYFSVIGMFTGGTGFWPHCHDQAATNHNRGSTATTSAANATSFSTSTVFATATITDS